ncbi:hypothetical protein [Sulfolobus acidocaldarius]|uniref:Uncharacterized protein n=4 Tax=Sulfolobus acidocaldarius TaxID=2285 RepID=Q4J7E4_SULAC|nr:hypothetical protein [Sulfolobus acidocaldarius]AAY81285.1 hypothetical protein Saci_1983 [Sulfolobus acidocaldarius DSM 639]AGE71920.1 hypothetical protein SacN8_09815 [Sulfolobus acidocaldarius N8]AGE74192.1 hypothetical protein SacRon12I_09835 [Sulfolobus acidocaldarius Ron12/I]ALU29911.1 hypothetical protein ATY89_08150 [Sulfolobus acidocaldarius]ALU32653.1 hypothetical protein ATZ20_11170 [Sulfolobus acidocaldarius]
MVKAVVYIEHSSTVCKSLKFIRDVRVKCTQGSKIEALKKYGIPDDDYHFAKSFIHDCLRLNPKECIAVIKDDRIEKLIKGLINEIPELKYRVTVTITHKFCMNNDEMIEFAKRILTKYLVAEKR